MYEEIDDTEKLMAVGIGLIALVLSFFISFKISSSIQKTIINMQEAVIITENEQFSYVMKTEYAGGVWGVGKVIANPITLNSLSGNYGKIVVEEERYTMHTSTSCDDEGNCTTTTTYSWDSHGTQTIIDPKVSFMGYEFSTSQVGLPEGRRLGLSKDTVSSDYFNRVDGNYLYEDDQTCFFCGVDGVGDLRWRFFVLPVEFDGTLYVQSTSEGFINYKDNPCGCSIVTVSPQEVIESAKKSMWFFTYIFPYGTPLIVIAVSLWTFYKYRN